MTKNSGKSKPKHIYASISVAIVLFLLGLFFVIFIHTQDLSNILKEKVNIVVEMGKEASSEAVLALLRSDQRIVTESIEHISKEDGLEFMTDGNSIDFSGDNPLRDLVVFNVRSTEYSTEALESIKVVLENIEEVGAVYYENMVLDNIKANIKKLATVILLLGLIFVFLAIVIIKNTINLSMYADRDEILTLQRLGAKWEFIKMPYIKSSVLVGVRGWVMALVMLVIIFAAVSMNFPAIWSSLNIFYILLSFLMLLIVAIAIPAIVSNNAANRYLQNQ